jgi:hypothetical protein
MIGRSKSSSPSREGARTESRQNHEPKGAIGNKFGGEVELDSEPKGAMGNRYGGRAEPYNRDDQNPTVNTLPQTKDVSVEYIFSLKTNDTASRKTDESRCHRDFS